VTTISVSGTIGISLNPALYTSPVVIDAGVTITNPNYTNAVYTDPGSTVFFTIQNHGTITGSSAGVGVYLAPGGSVTNGVSASITGGGVGVEIRGAAGTVVNDGSIAASYGVHMYSGGSVTNAASASITGLVAISGGAGTVLNDGSIAGSAAGVHLTGGGSVTNAAGASITGGFAGVYITGGAETVVNYGSIMSTGVSYGGFGAGIWLISGGSATNAASGSVSGALNGVEVEGGTGTVVNDGRIVGAGAAGVYLPAGGSVTNAATGTITGASDGVDLSAGGTLTNAGSIFGSGTAGTAVSFGGTTANRLVLDPGFGFTGVVSGSASASNTLELASAASAGTVTGLGTQFLHFSSIVFDAGAKWSVDGVARGFTGTISGFAAGDTIDITGGGALPATIIGGGTLQLDSGTFLDTLAQVSGVGSVVVDAGAMLDLTGGGALPATISGTGRLELAGATPYTLASGQTLGTSQVEVAAGATLSGAGTVALGAGATLILDPGFSVVGTVHGGGANSTLELAKGSGAGTLNALGTNFLNFGKLVFDTSAVWTVTLDNPTAFTGTISGFAKGDIVDLIDTAATSATYTGGKLTVMNGGTTVTALTLTGSYISSEFVLTPDFHGGTNITIGPPAPSGLSFAVAADDGTSGDTFTVAGMGEAGDTVTLYDGATAIGTAAVAAGGSWSITTASPLAVGAHSLSASEVDVAANKSPASPTQSVTIKSATPNAVVFIGTAGTDNFTGGAGNDIFEFSAANLAATDTVAGGAGTNYLLMTTAGTVMAVGVSAVEVYDLANGGANSLTLADANFTEVTNSAITVNGGNGGNMIDASGLTAANRVIAVGGAGTDDFTGGAGNDIFEFSAANLAATDTVVGGAGTNYLLMTTSGTVAAGGVSRVEIYDLSSSGADTLTLAAANFVGVTNSAITVNGGSAGNMIDASGLTGANRVIAVGGAGTDNFTGGAGNDIFEFSVANLAASDTVAGGVGTNYLLMTTAGTVAAGGVSGVEVYDLANGGANSLTLANANFTAVTNSAITINGGNGGNMIAASGLTGANRVIAVGGAGTDNFTGGAGNDIFEFSVANLAATDTVAGGAGTNYLLMTTSGTVAAGGVSGLEIYDLSSSGANSLTLADANFTGVTNSAITINGGNSGNTIDASGLTGANRVIAVGGAGSDVFFAGGKTTMTGGAGTNEFVFSAAGSNTIKDFTASTTNEIVFSNSGFALGLSGATSTPKPLPAGLLVSDATGAFTATTQRFAYNTTVGALYYDAQGNTTGSSRELVATLTGHPTFTATNLFFAT
jgi:Ca2+-binding RTX toxin-like protein